MKLNEKLVKKINNLKTENDVSLFLERISPEEFFAVIKYFYKPNEMLYEITYKDIKKDIGKMVSRTVKTLVNGTKYEGVTKDGMIMFTTLSAKHSENGLTYVEKIVPVELSDVLAMDDLLDKEKVNLAISGDLKMSCSCPAFKFWGFQYILTQLDAVEGEEETRAPKPYPKNPEKRRNTKLEGVVCKHLYLVIQVLPFHINNIVRDYRNAGVLPPKKQVVKKESPTEEKTT